MRGAVRELSPPEDAGEIVGCEADSRVAAAFTRGSYSAAAGCRARGPNLPRLQTDKTAGRISVSFPYTTDPPMDLPVVPARLHESLVRAESEAPNLERADS